VLKGSFDGSFAEAVSEIGVAALCRMFAYTNEDAVLRDINTRTTLYPSKRSCEIRSDVLGSTCYITYLEAIPSYPNLAGRHLQILPESCGLGLSSP